MPTVLPGTGVRVSVGNIAAQIYFVSPRQVNFLVPPNLRPGAAEVQVFVDGLVGPRVPVRLNRASPAFFEGVSGFALTAHVDGRLVLPADPAGPGDVVVSYATGLGETSPSQVYGQIPRAAAWIRDFDTFKLTIADRAVDTDDILSGISFLSILEPHQCTPTA
jgi:uncharacterized protein (TIGR03437 family)